MEGMLSEEEGKRRAGKNDGKRCVGLAWVRTGVCPASCVGGRCGPPALLHVSPTEFYPVPPPSSMQ